MALLASRLQSREPAKPLAPVSSISVGVGIIFILLTGLVLPLAFVPPTFLSCCLVSGAGADLTPS